ncbi:MAG: hypothetical protein QXQ13_06830 [Thermoplasmata archaeon]
MRSLHHETLSTQTRRGRGERNASVHRWLRFPFASISVLVVLVTLFTMSMIRGGWSWSSWTYAFSFAIMLPLVAIEVKRRAVITGGAVILLFFMVLIDAGMPGYLGYSPSDLNWYDNVAHYLGALVLTLFLWAFLCWTLSPDGPPKENGHRKFLLTIVAMLVVSVFFEFTEFFSDMLFGWRNFHPGVDTIGDIIFDTAGVMTAALVIGRHRYSPLKRPFWHAEPNPD